MALSPTGHSTADDILNDLFLSTCGDNGMVFISLDLTWIWFRN